MQTISLTIIKKSGGAISRVLSCAVICLARPLPDGSSGLPGARRAAVSLLFSLASDGACICPAHYCAGGSLLHCLFTLTPLSARKGRGAVLFCCAFPRVTPAGRYPASCPVKPGLSSPPAGKTLRRRDRIPCRNIILYTILYNHARLPASHEVRNPPPPMNSLKIEFFGTSSDGIPMK